MARDSLPQSDRLRTGVRTKRRGFLKVVGTGAIAATAGCMGGGGGGSSGGSGGATDIGDPPWSVEELRGAAEEEGGSFTSYWGGDPPELVNALIDAIGEEFDAPWLSSEIVSGDSANTGQRLATELSQGQVVPDTGQGLPAVQLDPDMRDEFLVQGIDEMFESFEPIADTPLVQRDQVDISDVGVKYAPIYHEEEWDAAGYPKGPLEEQSYNAIVTSDTYDGLTVIHNIETAWEFVGGYLKHYPPMVDMEREEWARALFSGLDILPNTSHSDGVRQLIAGEAVMQSMGYPDHVFRFQEAPLDVFWPKDFWMPVGRNGLFLLQNSDNPWAARFFMAAVVTEEIQQWMATSDDYSKPPARVDLEYPDANEVTRNLLGASTNVHLVGPAEFEEFVQIGQEVLPPIYDEWN